MMYLISLCSPYQPLLVFNGTLRYGHAAGNLRAHDTLWQQSTIKNRSQHRSLKGTHGRALTCKQGGTSVCRAPH